MSERDFAILGIDIKPNGAAEQRAACPCCGKGPKDDALGVNIETGAYHCFRCGWKGRAGGENQAPATVTRVDDPAVATRKRERLRTTYRETVALDHPKAHAVCRYLEARALGEVLKAAPKVLRAHPGLEYWDGTRSLGRYPAMVALFHGAAGEPISLHVTYLRHDGCAKAAVPTPKKILGVPVRGTTKGGAIRLYEPRGVLGIAEGIESALSLHLLHAVPVWSAYCADGLARLRLPNGLTKLLIGVDIDESGKGEAVAQDLAERVLRWRRPPEVFFVKPEGTAPRDLNDELLERRAS